MASGRIQVLAKFFVPAALVIVGIIHLLPLQGVLGQDRLAALYGISLDEPNILILMRHRAMLFGILGGFLVWASFRPPLYAPALIAGTVSILGFVVVALQSPERNEQIARVLAVDVFALVLLLVASAVYLRTQLTHDGLP